MGYDPNKNYSALKMKETQKLVNYFNKQYNSVDDLDYSQRQDAIEVAIRYPFLFKGTYLAEFEGLTSFHLYEFIHRMILNEYYENHSIDFQLSNTFLTGNFKETINFKDTRFPYTELNGSSQITFKTDLNFTVGLKVKIKEYKSWLSYIKVDMGTVFKSDLKVENNFDQNQELYEFARLWSPTEGNKIKRFRGTYHGSVVFNDQSTVFARIYMPVYYFLNQFYIEAGLSYYYYKYKSKVTITRSATEQESYDPIDLNNDPINIEKTLEKNSISQYFSINYDFFEFFTLKLESFGISPYAGNLGIEAKIPF